MESKSNNVWLPVFLLALLIAFAGFIYASAPQIASSLPEQPVVILPLDGPIATRDAELSGLAWYGETLILLPQYPERFGAGDGALFALPKAYILAALDDAHRAPLQPVPVRLTAPGLKESIANFQGYEAIGFNGDQVFVTVEAGEGTDMHGYLVRGIISSDLSEIKLDTSNVVEIPLPIQSENHSDEALAVLPDKILAFFEINGADLNPHPAAQAFDYSLNYIGTLDMPNIEYRVTDSALDENGRVWVINYFFPGDADLKPASDPLTQTYGQGQTHAQYEQVERLVAFDYDSSAITFANTPPVLLKLESKDANNWEGLALLDDRGFILVTDKYPSTLLGFVARP